MALLSKRRLLQFESRFFNVEIGIAGACSSFIVLFINWWGTGYVAWHAAAIRFVLSVAYNLFFPKIGEHLTRKASTTFWKHVWGNFIPNTVAATTYYLLYLWIGVPRPFWSAFPFWLLSLITFTQIVKHARKGYEPGVLDIVLGLWDDVKKPFATRRAKKR